MEMEENPDQEDEDGQPEEAVEEEAEPAVLGPQGQQGGIQLPMQGD